jgi:transcription elongation factor Elf1
MKSENFELDEYNYYQELQYVRDTKKCPRCNGNILFEWNVLPEGEITYTISCEQCGYIFDEE